MHSTPGDEGDTFYVLFSGTADIEVGGRKVGEYGAGHSFGELALLGVQASPGVVGGFSRGLSRTSGSSTGSHRPMHF